MRSRLFCERELLKWKKEKKKKKVTFWRELEFREKKKKIQDYMYALTVTSGREELQGSGDWRGSVI